ncbi:MAG TPA: TOMM precursor leader peptide-binding protein [Candidatus Dormibacteraeota bacterium]
MTGQDDPGLRAALHRHPDGATVVASASGRMFRVDLPPEELVERLAAGAESAAAAGEAFGRVVDTLRRDGCLGSEPALAGWLRFRAHAIDAQAPSCTSLLIVGDGRLADLALHLLRQDLGRRYLSTMWCDPPELDRVLGDGSGEPRIVLCLADHFDFDLLSALDNCSADHGVPWIPLHVDGGRGWLGPAIVPGATPCYRDVMARRLAAATSVPLFHALTNPPVHGEAHLPPDTALLWMLSILLAEVERLLVGVPHASSWNEVELDPLTFAVVPHPVLPLPGCGGLRPPRPLDMDALVDARTGIVTRVEPLRPHPAAPSTLRIVQSVACDMRRISFCANGRSNHGSSFAGEQAARTAAIAECIERYCGNWIDETRLVEASHRELIAGGEHAIDPERLSLHSPAQHAAAGFPFVPFTRELRVRWIRGSCLTCDRPAWIPASLVHVNWYVGRHAAEPPTNYAMFSGIAAGSTWDAALASGLEEVIERDATMIWWLNAHRLPAVRLTAELEALWDGVPAELGQRARLIHLDNEFDVPVMAGVIENARDGLLTIGFAARPDPVEAGLKAWAEALALQETARWMQDPAGWFWRSSELIDTGGLKAPRADRRYLDEYRSDFHDVDTLMSQLQVHLDRRAQELVRPWVDVAAVRPLSSLPRLPVRTAAAYRARLEARGFEVFAVDLTTPDVATTDLRVARVVVPGLVPNLPAAFPPLGGRRVRDAAVTLGWRDRPLEEGEVNLLPLPHA